MAPPGSRGEGEGALPSVWLPSTLCGHPSLCCVTLGTPSASLCFRGPLWKVGLVIGSTERALARINEWLPGRLENPAHCAGARGASFITVLFSLLFRKHLLVHSLISLVYVLQADSDQCLP